ncbi:hypothetical protein Tco_1328519 [Tanacetum coccineum]
MIPLTVPSPVASPATTETEGFLIELGARVEMQGGLIHDHTVRLGELSPFLFERYDRDIGELFTRSGVVRDEIFSQRYRFRSLEHEQERVAVNFRAIWRPVLALNSWAGQTDAQRAALWHAISDTFAMSSDNASSAVTYTFVSSNSNRPSSWGIPLVNAGELPKMDPYEQVAQQGQAHPLSPAYVPDLIELDEHVPVYVPEPEHPEYHAPSDDDIQFVDQPYADDASLTAESPGYIADSDSMEEDNDEDSIDYPDKPKDGEEDDDEDPEEEPSEEHEPKDDDGDDTDDEDEEPTKDEEEEEHLAPTDSSVVPVVDPVPSVGDTEAFETNECAPTPRSP